MPEMKSDRAIENAHYVDHHTYLGDHPLARFFDHPPQGYTFTCAPRRPPYVRQMARLIDALDPDNPPAIRAIPYLDRTMKELCSVARLARNYGVDLEFTRKFFHSRNIEGNMRLPEETELAFLTTIPMSLCSVPWILEIESATTLFFPYFRHGATAGIDFKTHPVRGMVRALLESPTCKAIITHLKGTADNMRKLFDSETIAGKTVHIPIAIPLTDFPSIRPDREDGHINLLFLNSWHQHPSSFYLRGGLEVLEAFACLAERYPQVTLTVRSAIPPINVRHERLLVSHPRLRLVTAPIPEAEMIALLAQTDLFLLPSVGMHVRSILQAFAHGIPVIASDGWGIGEYVEHEVNGLVVPGRKGIGAWMDEETGLLREDYSLVTHPEAANETLVRGLVAAVSRLIEDAPLRRELGRRGREDVETRFSLRRWNQALACTLDTLFI